MYQGQIQANKRGKLEVKDVGQPQPTREAAERIARDHIKKTRNRLKWIPCVASAAN